MLHTAKVFQNGRSQAIRLPKEFRVEGTEVYIEKIGHSILISAKQPSQWDLMRRALDDLAELDDFEQQRNQPAAQERALF
ncbi:antitoxin [Thiomicrorhabdus aquaedulcis]|uniref:antitoxin n=1 Tax=Thiomicrorhabdus aquaedulcis TaxID=2211106 RepID=UPI000FDA6D04|nr:type II toxin-antitoxin system VapB family antitoxin [Thiomicrorhabdus aquaedulcis]